MIAESSYGKSLLFCRLTKRRVHQGLVCIMCFCGGARKKLIDKKKRKARRGIKPVSTGMIKSAVLVTRRGLSILGVRICRVSESQGTIPQKLVQIGKVDKDNGHGDRRTERHSNPSCFFYLYVYKYAKRKDKSTFIFVIRKANLRCLSLETKNTLFILEK